jgi:hypothetical protein
VSAFADEVHYAYLAGGKINGVLPFRAHWGRLHELELALPKSTTGHATPATLPPHMLKVVEKKILSPGYIHVQTTSNRRNLFYATHTVMDSFNNLNNFSCFLVEPFNIEKQPKVLLFFDSISLQMKVKTFLRNSLPEEYRGDSWVVSLYNSNLAQDTLEKVYHHFTSKDATGRILCSTSRQSTVTVKDFPASTLTGQKICRTVFISVFRLLLKIDESFCDIH